MWEFWLTILVAAASAIGAAAAVGDMAARKNRRLQAEIDRLQEDDRKRRDRSEKLCGAFGRLRAMIQAAETRRQFNVTEWFPEEVLADVTAILESVMRIRGGAKVEGPARRISPKIIQQIQGGPGWRQP